METMTDRHGHGAHHGSRRLLCGTSMAALMLIALPTIALAQDQDRYWDANGTSVGSGGTGNWNTSSNIWSPSGDGVSGPYIAPWTNVVLDNAIFGGTAGTVTLAEPIRVHDIDFSVGGYTLTGDKLTLDGDAPTITATTGTTIIQSIVDGSQGLIKAGNGTLRLEGANLFGGSISLLGGGLYALTDAGLGAAGNSITTAAGANVTLRIDGSATSRSVVIGDGGTLSVSGSGVGGALISGNGNVNVLASNTTGGIVRFTNDSNSYTGTTRFNGCNGVCSVYFSSIADLGEVSSLGAPTDAVSGTILFQQSSQYSDSVIYTGDGDSSNRNWQLNGSAAIIRNQGTGGLTITGNIDSSGGGSFNAETAGFSLLGILSGVNYSFNASSGQSITLAGANTFTGQAAIAGLVHAPVLADIGAASSLGVGSDILLNSGTLSYTGAGGSSNRLWTANGVSMILNDGSGTLSLTGDLAFNPSSPASDSLTLGGSFTGASLLSGRISGNGDLIADGAGTWVLSGANTFVGSVTIESGTLQAGSTSAFGAMTGLSVNGGTLDLGGFDLTTPNLDGSGGVIALGANMLTVDSDGTSSFAGVITGSGGFAKAGLGALTLSAASSYTGDTSVDGGTLTLDFSDSAAPAANIIAAGSTLNLAGGALNLVGADDVANSQSFDGLNITVGNNRVAATSGAGGSMTVDFGTITRTGGLVDFVLPASGSFTTASTSLGGWATVNGSDYAKVVGGVITAFTAADYTQQDDAANWLDDQVVSDVGGAADTPFFNTVSGSRQLGGLKYTAAAGSTVNVAAGERLGIDGTIIVASSVGNSDQTITGGSLTGGVGGSTLGILQNGGGRFTIGSTIVDNGGATGFTKGGEGIVRLAGANSYTGVTTLSGGELQVASLANGGLASSIGAASVDSSNLVLESGTLHYVGGTDASTNRGFTLVNGGASDPVIAVDAGRTIAFSGLVTSPDDAGLTKTGWGTLVLSNAANDYVGVTTIQGGGGSDFSTISVNTLADGGAASGIGAATSDSANLILSNGGRLQYTGGTAETDRGFTLASGSGRIDVAQAATTLTVGGAAIASGRLIKEGAGTLVLSGANSYTGGTLVSAGTLVAGSATAFGGGADGTGAGALTVDAGAMADLAGNSVFVGGLNGAGSVLLGGATFNINSGGSFSGTISGAGGLSVTRYTQTMTGCNNDYTGVTSITSGLSVDCLADGGQASGIGASGSAAANLVFNGGTLSYTGGSTSTDRGFTLGSDGYINVANAATVLEFEGAIVGSGRLRKTGAGVLLLSGANSSTGDTFINEGILRAGASNALGARGFSLADLAGTALDLNGFDSTIGFLNGGGASGGDITLSNAMLTLNWSGGSATYGGAISGSGGLIKNGSISQSLTGCDSSYTGSTVINGGILAISCLTDGGVASSIGASGAGAGNLVINGGRLTYTGAAGSTDRQFTLGASGGNAIYASGTGAIAFTSTAPITFSSAGTAQTLTLGGTNSGNNSFAPQIGNNGAGITSLTKTDAGTWVLTNSASSYTGATRISGGVLGVDKLADGGLASSIGASSAAASNLVIGNGSTLRYTGAGDTTNRLFTLSAGVTYIESSGTGAIVFTDTGPVTLQSNNQARTIALGGTNSGNNTLAGSIGDAGSGITTLAKNDGGTWVLTGNHSYTGSTNVNAGILSIGGGGTTGSIVSAIVNNDGTLAFNRSDSLTYGGTIVGAGGVQQNGAGTTILTGDSIYTGGTTISAGTLQLGNGGASGSIVGDVLDNGVLAFNRSTLFTFDGVISGSGAVHQDGGGTTVLTGTNSYAGGTTISAGRLQISRDANLGAASGALSIGNGALETTATITSARNVALTGHAVLAVNTGTTFTLDGVVSGVGLLDKRFAGTLVLTADNLYTGGTTIAQGILQLGDGGTSGSIMGDVANDGSLAFFRSDDIGFGGMVSGTGSVVKNGAGILTLTADNSYAGATTVNAGTLRINGDQSAATGLVHISSGATLGGSGIIGGTVNVVNGGTLAPGNSPGTLTINGDLLLASGSILDFELGEADVVGGPLNDLVNVDGNLQLDGTINVTVPAGGAFDGGIYRIFNYGGTLTDNGLDLGTMPSGSIVTVQTSVAGQVNLINSAGLELAFWDGDGGPKFNGTVDGGNGSWHIGGSDNNWTGPDGSINAAYADGTFAIFAGTGGTVAVDNGGGAVTASGMQFASDGYLLGGDALTLVDAQSVIRVGDGTTAGAAFTATIANDLTGAAQVVKTDAGRLILSGINSYTGGTLIDEGVLSIADDVSLGDIAGSITINQGTLETTANLASARNITLDGAATILTDTGTTFLAGGIIAGTGSLTKAGGGTLVLAADEAYTGGTMIADGMLQIGNGGVVGSVIGDITNNGALLFDRADAFTYAGKVSGTGSLTQQGIGQLSLTGISSYSGATAVNGGTLILQAGGQIIGTSALTVNGGDLIVTGAGARIETAGSMMVDGAGSITLADGGVAKVGSGTLALGPAGGDLNIGGSVPYTPAHAGTLDAAAITLASGANGVRFIHDDAAYAFAAVISGAGWVYSYGPGTTILTGDNSYTGETAINGGMLVINGDQSAATGLVGVTVAGALGGNGTIGGNVQSSGRIAPGDLGDAPGTLTINGNLILMGGSNLDYQFGQANVVGGAFNDLIEIGSDLTLEGMLNVETAPGGALDPGVYRIMSYGGALADNGLTLNAPSPDFYVQTSVPGQVNLVNTDGMTLRYWDGDTAASKNNSLIEGGNGLWQPSSGNDNWTEETGAANAPFTDGAFAVFLGAAGTVNVDNGLGQVTASGMQFLTDGYVIQGGAIDLVGAPTATIRVGDGTTAGADITATIASDLTGASQLVKADLGTLILTGNNSYAGGTVISSGVLQIGDGGTSGSIVGDIVDNGTLTFNRADNVTIAGAITGTGSVNQIGGGTTTLTAESSYSGETHVEAGTLLIADGGEINGTSFTAVRGTGVLTVTGETSSLTTEALAIGDLAGDSATLTILNGATATVTGTSPTALGSEGHGTILVDGSGSSLTAGALELGAATASMGILTITNGGRVTDTEAIVGSNEGAGEVLVSGQDSFWETSGRLTLASAGTGMLTISDGATVTSGESLIGSAARGDAILSGAGTTWATAGQLTIGSYDVGTLRIEDGAVATSNQGYIGAGPTADGTVVVTGQGSTWASTAFNINIGNYGAGALTIADGALVQAIGGVELGLSAADASGTLLLQGTTGARGVLETSQIRGGLGTASVTIDGGIVRATEDAVDFVSGFGTQTINLAANGGTLDTNGHDIGIAAQFGGAGGLLKAGSGTLTLSGANGYAGMTTVETGTLLVNGDQSAATGLTTVSAGATLGGTGTIGGDVTIASGGILAPGNSPGTLTINGDLALDGGSLLAYEFGEAGTAGGALNDLVEVGGDLVLDGTINVTVPTGGSFGPGIYRVFNYDGALTDNGLALGAMPSGSTVSVQTAIGGQVNLVNTAGATFSFWDGDAGPKSDAAINGGDGVWRVGGGGNDWTDMNGSVNADYAQDSFAIFSAASGTVTVDNSNGDVLASGMQFASDGYVIAGDALTLTGVGATLQVGDGSTAGATYIATIDAELTGAAQLVKTDAGTLILTGTNSYAGGTAINGGTLHIVADANLGDAAGGLSFDGGTLQTTADIATNRAIDLGGNGAFLTDTGTVLTLNGAVSGAGGIAKTGAGTLVLAGLGNNMGGINVGAGTLWVNGDFAAATGLTGVASGATLGGTGTIGGDVMLADGAILTPGAGGAGTLAIGGSLSMAPGSTLAFEFGEANVTGGALNDLVTVGGDLTLDGTIDVTVPAGGAFDAGVYRVFDYGGALTDNGLALGAMPTGSAVAVQTSIAGQVNLVNSAGLTLNFWDGAAGPKNDGVIQGGSGLWQTSTGNDNWTDANGTVNAGYADGAFAVFSGTGGTVTVDDSLGAVTSGGMQFAADGYTVDGDALALVGAVATIRVGDGSAAGADYTAMLDTALTGDSQLVKTDAGTLILTGANSYTGGTAINGGTVQISADANLGDGAGDVTLNGGTLATAADLSSERGMMLAGAGAIATAGDTTFTFGGRLSGSGVLTKQGAGILRLTGDNSSYSAATTVAAGTLAVDGVLGGAVAIDTGARLAGNGRVGDVANAGAVAPGRDGFGTLTVGAYAGNGGVLEIETALGGDTSETDRLVVTGGTSGSTAIAVTNRGGLGARTVEGIKLVDVTGGASDGTFTLRGDYVFEGDQAVVAGAYGYRLYQGGVSTPSDGDWYLRSALLDGPEEPQSPLYQPGVPLYENYAQTLQTLNGLPTMQERVGNRRWAPSVSGVGSGIWGRMEASRFRPEARVSTSGSDVNIDSWQLQAGVDHTLAEKGGSLLVAGLTAHYGEANAAVRSIFGSGSIHANGYGVGATLTWYAPDGFYADGQAQFTWFDGRLKSSVLGTLADDSDGHGQAFSVEAGKRSPVGGGFTLTPQLQMSYQNVRFDAFEDPSNAAVASRNGDSLKTRGGLSIDHDRSWEANGGSRRTHLYGLFNLSYEWLDGTSVDVAGTPIRTSNDRLWGEAALGGSLGLGDRLTIYTQVSASSALHDFGDSYNIKGTAGVRLVF